MSDQPQKTKFYQAEPSGEIKEIFLEIPPNVLPENTGTFFASEIQKKYPDLSIPSSTASVISNTAGEIQREGWRLTKVVVGVGFPQIFNLSFEFGRE